MVSVSRWPAGISRSSYYRPLKDWQVADREVIEAINEVLRKAPRAGFWECFQRIRRQCAPWNHKRVYRVYCHLELNLRRRAKKRLPNRLQQPLQVMALPNRMWALDFMQVALYSGKRFRVLNILDEGTRGMSCDRDRYLAASGPSRASVGTT